MTDQKKISIEEQIEDLSNFVITFDNVIKDMDNIIDIYQRQRITFIEKCAKLNALKDTLMSHSAANNKSVAGALTITAAIEAAHFINNAINTAHDHVDKETARIEQKLKEQREWKAEHPGHQG